MSSEAWLSSDLACAPDLLFPPLAQVSLSSLLGSAIGGYVAWVAVCLLLGRGSFPFCQQWSPHRGALHNQAQGGGRLLPTLCNRVGRSGIIVHTKEAWSCMGGYENDDQTGVAAGQCRDVQAEQTQETKGGGWCK